MPSASARPAIGGRIAPSGACVGLSFRGWHRSCVRRPAWGGGRGAFSGPARPGGGRKILPASPSSALNGKGHRLCHNAKVTPNGPGAKAPGQRTPRQRRALSHPPGHALASCFAGGTGPAWGVPRGRGKRGAFPGPARPGGVMRGGGFRAAAAGQAPQPQPTAGVLRSAGQGGPPESRSTKAWAAGIWLA